jgi:hypothetical protein
MFHKEFKQFLDFLKKRALSTILIILIIISVVTYQSHKQNRQAEVQEVVDLILETQAMVQSQMVDLNQKTQKMDSNQNNYQEIITQIENLQTYLTVQSEIFPTLKMDDDLQKIRSSYQDYLNYLSQNSLQIYLQNYTWHQQNYAKLLETNKLKNIQEKGKKTDYLRLVNAYLKLIQDYRQNISFEKDRDLELLHRMSFDKTNQKLLELKEYLEKTVKDKVNKENYRFISKEIFKDDLDRYFNQSFLVFNIQKVFSINLSRLENQLLFQTKKLSNTYKLEFEI